MGRGIKGSVDFHGNPPRWWARVTETIPMAERKPDGPETRRRWVDLESSAPIAEGNTAAGKRVAQARSLIAAKLAKKGKPDAPKKESKRADAVLADIGDKWSEHLGKDPELKPGTVGRYKSAWSAGIVPDLGQRLVSELTPSVLREWIEGQRNAGKVGASTICTNAAALRRFFKNAMAKGWIPKGTNPMDDEDVREALPTVETPDLEDLIHFTLTQLEKLLGSPALDDYSFGYYMFAALTGMRDGEILGAQLGDLREEGEQPYVQVLRQAVVPPAHSGRHGVELGTLKTKNSKRKVPVHPLLESWLSWWAKDGWEARVGRKPKAEDVLFPSPEGDAWRPRTPDILRDHLVSANLPANFTTSEGTLEPFTMHAFRRTFCTLLGENEVSGETIDRLVGHTNRSTRAKHYQASKLAPLVRAIDTLALTLPERRGTSLDDSASAIARESSFLPGEIAKAKQTRDVGRAPRRTAPSPQEPTIDGKNSGSASNVGDDTGDRGVSISLGNTGQALLDDSPDPIAADLARAIAGAIAGGAFALAERLEARLESHQRTNPRPSPVDASTGKLRVVKGGK